MPPQLQSIISDMHRAIEARLYYPALTVALTLPEVCCGLAFADPKRHVTNCDYARFIKDYTDPIELGLDGPRCYKLRCGMIHKGNAAGHAFFGSSHVIFTVPETEQSMHASEIERNDKELASVFDLLSVCQEIERGVKKWYDAHKDNPTVADNLPGILSWRPNGVDPFFVGRPVIASGK